LYHVNNDNIKLTSRYRDKQRSFKHLVKWRGVFLFRHFLVLRSFPTVSLSHQNRFSYIGMNKCSVPPQTEGKWHFSTRKRQLS
jgi:hypothetical protein